MNGQQKISIRFFDDREVRAIWDEQNAKWWFSVVDVVGILNQEADYTKVRNYWKYLKTKLKKEKNELVSATNQLKLSAQMEKSAVNNSTLKELLKNALADQIHSREMFLKGIDYSWYYEEI